MKTLNKQIQLSHSETDQYPKVYQVDLMSEGFIPAPYPIKEFPMQSRTEKSVIIVTRRSDDTTDDAAVLLRKGWSTDRLNYFTSREEAEAFWEKRLQRQIDMAEKLISEVRDSMKKMKETSSTYKS